MILTRLPITLYEKVGRQLSCVPNSNIYHILTGNRLVAPDVMAMGIFWQMTPGHISKKSHRNRAILPKILPKNILGDPNRLYSGCRH